MKRFFGTTALLVIAASLPLSLAGCTSDGSSSSSSPSRERGEIGVAPDSAGGSKAADAGGTVNVKGDRQVITTGTVTLTAPKPADAADRAVALVEAAGGRVDGRTERAPTDGDEGGAQLTLRIPSTKLTAVIDDIKELGSTVSVDVSSSDVTSKAQDLDARITALRASVNRLVTLMSAADSTADLISIESALSDRQANLESLEAEKRGLSDQIDLATITLRLESPAAARGHLPDSFLGGLGTGWNALVVFVSGALVLLGVALPWLVLAGLITVVVLLAVRFARRRRQTRDRLQEPSPSPAAVE
jgi:hypothetical protein